MPRARKWWIAAAAAAAGILVVLFGLGQYLSSYARGKLIQVLREHYKSDVGVRSVDVSLLPPFSATLQGLTLRHHGRTDVPPLIAIERASASVGVMGLIQSPKRVRDVRLEGLVIHIPPRREGGGEDKPEQNDGNREEPSPFLISRIIADGTHLRILPKQPGKDPLDFNISRLRLHSVGIHRPMEFDAELHNARPPGLIRSKGHFGPWSADEPGDTPVSGDYTFQNANLGVFRGISGTLASEGHYSGKLGRIEVKGTTDTPDFMVNASGHRVHLKTEFQATVDGTDGDTQLHPVTAHFLNSTVVAYGSVAGTPGMTGKTVTLDATVEDGRVEDMLRLAVKSENPVLTGAIGFQSKIVIPPGDIDIADKLQLDGRFGLAGARFTSSEVREKVATLSKRGQGDTSEAGGDSVASNFSGAFTMRGGAIHFARLRFTVPGADITLAGDYGVRTEKLDFEGEARLQARVSEMTTGVKSVLLKLVDPLFAKKKAGAVIPIHIGGTRDKPSFGLDVGRVVGSK